MAETWCGERVSRQPLPKAPVRVSKVSLQRKHLFTCDVYITGLRKELVVGQ